MPSEPRALTILRDSKWIVPGTTRVYAPRREVDARHDARRFGLYFVLLPIRERLAAFDPIAADHHWPLSGRLNRSAIVRFRCGMVHLSAFGLAATWRLEIRIPSVPTSRYSCIRTACAP